MHTVVVILVVVFVTGRRRVFTHGLIFRFFAPHGRHTAPIKVKFHLDPLRGVGLRPQKIKISNFTNIIAHKGRVPCTIPTKFIAFMHVLSLHNSAKFGCFISINDKTIKKLTRCGHFQPNFR